MSTAGTAPDMLGVCDEAYAIWCAARCEANDAYDAWSDEPGTMTYAVYLAAEDRADAAEQGYRQACADAGLPLLASF